MSNIEQFDIQIILTFECRMSKDERQTIFSGVIRGYSDLTNPFPPVILWWLLLPKPSYCHLSFNISGCTCIIIYLVIFIL